MPLFLPRLQTVLSYSYFPVPPLLASSDLHIVWYSKLIRVPRCPYTPFRSPPSVGSVVILPLSALVAVCGLHIMNVVSPGPFEVAACLIRGKPLGDQLHSRDQKGEKRRTEARCLNKPAQDSRPFVLNGINHMSTPLHHGPTDVFSCSYSVAHALYLKVLDPASPL